MFPDGRFGADFRTLTGAASFAGGNELFDHIVEADLRSRLLTVDLPELQVLRSRVRDVGPVAETLGWWLDAIIAERLMVDFDPSAVLWATTRLHELPDDPFAPVPVIYARARLRRIASVGYLLAPSGENLESFRGWRDESIADFIRCGFHDEAAATRAVGAGLVVIFTWDDVWQALDRLNEATVQMGDPYRSSLGLLLQYMRAVVAFNAGDMWTAHEALDDIDAAEVHHPLLSAIVPIGRALARLIADPGDEVVLGELDRCINEMARVSPRYPAFYQHLVAQVLADLRRPEARRYALAAMDMPAIGGHQRRERQLLEIRIGTFAGIVPAAADVKELLHRVAESGRVRVAANMALRIARDVDALGQAGEADVLRAWGLAHLPAPSELTLWELVFARAPAAATAEPPVADDALLDLRIMTPSFELEREGETLHVHGLTAKLLVLLAALHPRPLSVEQAVDALWDEPLTRETRARLNTILHRLRKVVGPDVALVSRRGDLLSFDATDCRVDLLEIRGRLGRGDDTRAGALLGVRGNLCAAQFPDDDRLLDERERFVGEWLEHVRHLPPELRPDADLDAALAALGLTRRDLEG